MERFSDAKIDTAIPHWGGGNCVFVRIRTIRFPFGNPGHSGQLSISLYCVVDVSIEIKFRVFRNLYMANVDNARSIFDRISM